MKTTPTLTPSQRRLMRLLSRKNGVSAAEAAVELAIVAHSVRAMISRLQSVGGVKVASCKVEGRGTVHRVGKGAGR
jgi:predicted ArsR family transcriptional regulator